MCSIRVKSVELFDEDGYPSDEVIKHIASWDGSFTELLDFVKPLWAYANVGYWTQEGCTYKISTAGWSGNEDIIEALKQNLIFWCTCWEQSTRGGHYVFKIPEPKKAP